MIPCPSCHQSVEILDKHLGTLFTCPHCNAVFFVNWDGQPEMATHETEPEPAPNFEPPPGFDPMSSTPPAPYGEETKIAPMNSFNEAAEEAPAESYYQENPPAEDFQNAEVYQEPAQNIEQEQNMGLDPSLSPIENALLYAVAEPEGQPQTVDATQEEAQADYDFSQSLDQQPPEPTPIRASDNSDFSDVTDFANTNTSSGSLTYVVIIDGIESSFLLKQLKEAMTDSRFGWDVSAILEGLGGGRLILNGLSPAKASVLINRIKYLPFKISWRQDVLTSS